jgi:hypothetical protein
MLSDLHGNELRRLKPHRQRVNDISTDMSGEHIASCSADGTVVINSVREGGGVSAESSRRGDDAEGEELYAFSGPMLAVKIDPAYGRRRERLFVAGGASGSLLLNRKGWFSHKEVVLHEGEGAIGAIAWRGSLVAWASEAGGVKVLDVDSGARLACVERPRGARVASCSAHLYWESEDALLVGWGDVVMSLRIAGAGEGGPPCVIQAMWQCDCIIGGLSPFERSSLALLGLGEEAEGPYEVLIVDRESGSVKSADATRSSSSTAAKGASPLMRSTCWSASSHRPPKAASAGLPPALFIVSPGEVLVGRIRGVDDRVSWALERGDTRGAVDVALANRHGLRAHSLGDLIAKHLESLFERGRWQEAAAACPQLLGDDATSWERWIYAFAKRSRLGELAPYVPVSDPRLPSLVYEMMLEHLMSRDPSLFLAQVRKWEDGLYSVPVMIARLEAALAAAAAPSPILVQAQAELFVMDKQYERAARAYLALPKGALSPEAASAAFELIERHSLFACISHDIVKLIELDREEAGRLLLRHFAGILPVASIVAQLQEQGRREVQHWYLHMLFTQAPEIYNTQEYASFHVLQVALYAEHSPPFMPGRDEYDSDLLRFLSRSSFAPLETALTECEKRTPPLYDEMVYILGQLGRTQSALSILLQHVRSVRRAIEFVESHDKELWYRLIEYSLRDETFLGGLLDCAGAYNLDLPRLIREIPQGMHVTGLRQKLSKIVADYSFQVTLHQTCLTSLRSDYLAKHQGLSQARRRAVRVVGRPTTMTRISSAAGAGKGDTSQSLAVFACGHFSPLTEPTEVLGCCRHCGGGHPP